MKSLFRIVPCVLILGCFLFASASIVLRAEESRPQYTISREGEGFIARELRRNRTWPRQDMANRLQGQGDIQGAAAELEALLQIDPLEDNARLQLIILLDQLDESDRVLRHVQELHSRHPDDPLPLLYQGMALSRLGQTVEAEKAWSRALTMPGLDPEQRAETALNLAHMALGKGEYEQVLQILGPGAGHVWPERLRAQADLLQGLALAATDALEPALNALEMAALRARTRQERVLALDTGADVAVRLGQYDRARGLLLRTIDTERPEPGLERRVAELALKTGKAAEAEEHFRRALHMGDLQAQAALAQILFDQGRLGQAETEASAWAERADGTEQARAWAMLGFIRERRGDLDGAAKAFERVAAREQSAEVLMALARVYAELGRDSHARAAYEQALEQAPTAPHLFELGLFLARDGHHEQAVEIFNRVLADHPRTPETPATGLSSEQTRLAWEQLGHALSVLGRSADADQAWNIALRLSAGQPRPDLLTALGDSAWNRGRVAQAAKYYEQAWRAGGRKDADLAQRAGVAWLESGGLERALELFLSMAMDRRLENDQRSTAWERVAQVQEQFGRPLESSQALLQAAFLAPDGEISALSLTDQAINRLVQAGETGPARAQLADMVARTAPGPARAEVMLRLAQLEETASDPERYERALSLLRQADAQPGLSAALAGRLAETEAVFLAALGNPEQALSAVERAVSRDGITASRALNLGYLYAQTHRYDRAVDAFFEAVNLGAMDTAWIGLARSYQGLNKPGLAMHALGQVPLLQPGGSGLDGLPTQELVLVMGLKGFVNEELGRPDQAALWYERTLDLEDDPVIRFRLARSLFALGQVQRADELLCSVESSDLPQDELLSEITLRAQTAAALGHLDEARAVYQAALARMAADKDAPEQEADVWFALGGLHRQQGEHEAAAEAFAQASRLNRRPASLTAEGYELLALKRREDAQAVLSEAVAVEPDYLPAHQDLGYIAMQLGDNEPARTHFMDAIDHAPLRPVDDEVQGRIVAEDVRRMRGEMRALNNAVDLDAWLTYTSGKTGTLQADGQPSGLAAPERDVIRTSSGIELGWIPPQWGFQDHRIFKLIGRLGWNLRPDSLTMVDDSLEGALGLRYKPFKAYNLNIGLERIFSLSGDGEDNWVARLMGSLADGMDDVRPYETIWNYSFLFGEVDAYLESPSRLAAYVEARQGVSWKWRDDLILSPFLVADAKWWSRSRAADVSFYEAGAGFSLRYLYDQDKYELERRSIELLLTYKAGKVFDTDDIKDERINALFATILFRF